jgi:CheY-like chemotaxis protein
MTVGHFVHLSRAHDNLADRMQFACILVVDNDRASCLLLTKMITSLGYTCDFVHNVVDGLRAAACKDYALVLVDSFLPMDYAWLRFNAT